MGNYKIFLGLFGFCALSVSAGAALAATAGHAQFINGNVQITDSSGRVRALQKGDAVNEGDMITSAKAASAQIRMQDGGFVAVRPETQLKFDQFNFKGKEDGSERGFFSLLKGGFRAVTGLIGRTNKENYRVTTPAATIGIRGTDHESFFAPVNLPGALAGAYSKVNVGETSLTTNVGTVYVKPNQMGYAGGLNQSPKLQPVNTNIFTVAAAPAKEVKKEEQKTAGGENGKGETQKAVAAPAETEEVRSSAVVDNTGTAEASVAVAAPTTGGTLTDEVAIVLPTEEVVPIELVDPTGTILLNATEQTIINPNTGQETSIQNGTFDVLAQAAADAAMAAWVAAQTAASLAVQVDTTLGGIAQVSTAPADTAIAAANSVIGTASFLVNDALALTPADATAAANNVASAQATAATVASQASAAQVAIASNGIFADSTAVAANNLINTPTTGAAALVQSAKVNVETAASTVTAQNTALANAKTAASSALNGANTSVTTANGLLTTANTQNTAIVTAQTSAAGLVSQAQAAEAAALAARDNAQTAADLAASLQAAGDFTGAAAQLAVAQDQQTIAQQQQAIAESAKATLANQLTTAQAAQTAASTAVSTATTAANTAVAAAGTGATGAQTYAAAAQIAASNAAAALAQTVAASTGTAANTVQVQAGIVAANVPITVYSNPAVNTALGGNDGFGHWALATRPAPKEEFIAIGLTQPQTTYVLDGNKDLIEIRNSEIDGNGYNYFNPSPVITGANIKLSGGAANDHFQFTDNTGYMGRWRGGNIDVNGSPYIALGLPGLPGTTSIHWGIFLSPSLNYVQNLIGTANYTLVASTHPTDSFGNTGTLNSAFINANFTTQTLDTGVNLSFSTSDVANVSLKNMAFSASATGVPIVGSGFDASPAAIGSLAFGCAGADCDPNGYQGDIVGQFVGADAIHAALGYSIHAVVPGATTGQPHADLIHGMAAFSTATAPVLLPAPATVFGNPPVWTNLYSYEVVAASGVPGAYTLVNPFDSSLANTVFGLDATDNLLEINRPASNKEYFSGGTALDTWKSVGSTIYMGRWQGGSLTTLDSLGQPIGLPVALGAGSAHWIVSANTPPSYIQSLIGTATYTLAMATAPTDALGNAGSLLNTSTITADFTTQLVNMALNIQFAGARSSAFTVSTSGGIPIGGDTIWGGGTVTCAGTCDVGGYSSNLWGRFAGDTASEVALAYHIDATSSADIIQGAAAFATATAPTVLTGGPFAAYVPNHVAVEFASPIGWWWDSLLVDSFNLTYSGVGLSSILAQDFGCCQTQTFSVIGGIAPVTASATSFITTDIEFGRWTSVTALESTHNEPLGQFGWGGRQAWMYGPMGYIDPETATAGLMNVGTFSYTLDGSTAPFDRQSRQKGTLTGASISANFAASTFSASLALNVANQFWSASATDVPMGGNQFFASSVPGGTGNNLDVFLGAGAPAACPTCYGSLSGAFTGQNYAGAILSYNLWDNGNLGGDVSGNAALVRGTAVSNGTPQTVFGYFVAESGSGSGANIQVVDTLNSTAYTQVLNPGVVLASYSGGSPAAPSGGYFSSTVSGCPGCTVSSTANTPNTGIYFGAWDEGSFASTWGGGIGSASPHWITGPEAGPLFLSQALVGTKTFAFDGGMVTNGNGVPGTVQGTTALTVNFTKQAVGINIDLLVPDTQATPVTHTWKAQTLVGNEAPIQVGNGIGGATFHASSFDSSPGTGLLTVTVDGATATPGNGDVSGQLTGAGLNGAIMSFDLNWNPASPPFFQQVNGVAALVAPNQAGAPGGVSDVATPHRWVMTSLATPDSITKSHLLGSYANDPARMTFSGSNLTKFDMNWIDDRGKGASETLAINATTPPALVNAGNDTPTGISWGRWEGGSGDSTNRVTGNTPPTHPLAGSLHWIAGPTATAPVTLPVSGAFTYNNVGGTSPTDNLGNVGVLNSATLEADFTNLRVNMGVNVSVAGTTLNASATNAPIIQKTAFWAGSNAPVANPSHLAVTCSAGCGTSHQGTIMGGFGGAGATGAMMAYGLEKISGASTQVISGVAAFQRGAPVVP